MQFLRMAVALAAGGDAATSPSTAIVTISVYTKKLAAPGRGGSQRPVPRGLRE
jgi:hypothetical protein